MVVRENIEWLRVWLPEQNSHDLPRVLLVGDSICDGYGPGVEQQLAGTAYVGRLCTSKSLGDPALLAEIALVLSHCTFDVIHFNNGLHGWGYSEEQYAAALPDLLATLGTGARLLWRTTTPTRDPQQTARVVARNALAAEAMAAAGVPVHDLYAFVVARPEWLSPDGVHFTAEANAELAAEVARAVREELRS